MDPGFAPQPVLTAQFNLPSVRYKSDEAQVAFMDRVLERVSALPGVVHVGTNNSLPLSGGSFVISYTVQGRPAVPPQDQPSAAMRFVSPDYLAAMKVPMIKGRGFTAQDRLNSPPVIIINEALARREFPHEDPMGKQMVIGYSNSPVHAPKTIVGVVKDMKITAISGDTEPQYYVPFAQMPFSGVAIAVRTAGDPGQLTATFTPWHDAGTRSRYRNF